MLTYYDLTIVRNRTQMTLIHWIFADLLRLTNPPASLRRLSNPNRKSSLVIASV